MSSVIIRVGVALDRDVIQVLAPVHAAIKKARAQIAAEMKGVADAGKHAAKETADASKRSAKQQVQDAAYLAKMHIAYRRQMAKATEDSVNAEDKALKAAISDMNRSYKAYTRERSRLARDEASEERRRWREMASERRRVEDEALADVRRRIRERRTAEREHSRAERAREQRMSAIGAGAMRLGAMGLGAAYMVGSRAVGFGRSLVEGAGADLSFGGLAQKEVELESRAITLANQAYLPGEQGDAGFRQDPRNLIREVRNVGNALAFDPNEVLAGLQKFVDKTGDLRLGRDVLSDMSKLAKAVGANLEDVVDASADVANNLGEVENKGEVVSQVMRQVAGMGKVGAVELKDLAVQMAKIAAQAGVFTGPRAKTIQTLTMFAEEARMRGGAASPAQAATAVQSFVAQFSKGKRLEGFRNLGIQVYNAANEVRDPRELILELLQKTGADPRKMQPAIYEQQAQRVTRGFASIYRETYNLTKGTEADRTAAATAAVRQEFERLDRATIARAEVEEAVSFRLRSTEDQMTLLNNRLREAVRDALPSLIESFKEVSPWIAASTRAFGDLVKWANKLLGVQPDDKDVFKDAPKNEETARKLRFYYQNAYEDARPNPFGGPKDADIDFAQFEAADRKLVELEGDLREKEKALKEAEARAPKKPVYEFEGEPVQVNDRFGGYKSREDQIRGDEVERNSKAVEVLRQQVEEARGAREWLSQQLRSGAIQVRVVNTPATKEPSGRPGAKLQDHVTDSHPE